MLFFNWKLVETIYFFPEKHFSGKAICDFIYSDFLQRFLSKLHVFLVFQIWKSEVRGNKHCILFRPIFFCFFLIFTRVKRCFVLFTVYLCYFLLNFMSIFWATKYCKNWDKRPDSFILNLQYPWNLYNFIHLYSLYVSYYGSLQTYVLKPGLL